MNFWTETLGRSGLPITQEEAAKHDAANKPIKLRDPEELPFVKFPAQVLLLTSDGDVNVDFNGQLGMLSFTDGRCDVWNSYSRLMQFASAGYRIADQATAAEIGPLSVNTKFRAQNQFWNYGMDLPDHVIVPEKDEVDANLLRQKKSEKEVTPVIPEPTIDADKITRLVGLFLKLRPNHKEDWVKGLPDCNRMSSLLKEWLEAETPEGQDFPFTAKVTKKERNLAWEKFHSNRLNDHDDYDEQARFADAVAVGGLRERLEASMRVNGIVYIRQIAEDVGVSEPSQDEEKLLDQIIAAEPTEQVIKKLI